MSGRASKRKGSKIEREFVELHRALGLDAKRVPLSGAAAGWKGDIKVIVRGREITGEVKARGDGSGFKTLKRWLGENDALFLREDRADGMVVLPMRTWAWLVGVE
ncbi:MAG: hypothetical protein E6Q97_14530 [Desulfurellales bacterium]|nr:MAG: hypothetical protein E6Q97_14530 [Desulfurellales bacterium]